MKSLIGSLLDSGGWKAYESSLIELFLDVSDSVHNTSCDRHDLAICRAFEMLETLHPARLAEAAPFFWLNLHRVRRAQGTANCHPFLRDVLMTGFDSYFHFLPGGTTFELPPSDGGALVLPRLGIRVSEASPSMLRRLSSTILEIEVDSARYTFDLPTHPGRAATCRISDEPPQFVLAVGDRAVTTSDVTNIVAENALEPFSRQIPQALALIKSVDRQLYESIRRTVQWFVPLMMPSPSVHYSRSARDLVGVVHLSEGYSGVKLAEAIVHEFHHNELYALQRTQNLTHDGDRPVYYSPWQTGPRPISGLLHALHAFSGLLKFYGAAVHTIELNEATNAWRRELCQKLRVCMAQVPVDAMTPIGHLFLKNVEHDVMEQETKLGIRSDRIPETLIAHARQWCRDHPACVQFLSLSDPG